MIVSELYLAPRFLLLFQTLLEARGWKSLLLIPAMTTSLIKVSSLLTDIRFLPHPQSWGCHGGVGVRGLSSTHSCVPVQLGQ